MRDEYFVKFTGFCMCLCDRALYKRLGAKPRYHIFYKA